MVGVKDERMGEEVCACIKLVEGQDCTVDEIRAYCKGKVSQKWSQHFYFVMLLLFLF